MAVSAAVVEVAVRGCPGCCTGRPGGRRRRQVEAGPRSEAVQQFRSHTAGVDGWQEGRHEAAAETGGVEIDPADVARASLDGVQAGAIEVLVDAPSRFVKAALSGDPAQLYGPPSGN